VLVICMVPLASAQSGVEALVVEATVAELQAMMADGVLSSESITLGSIARIRRLDPDLRAVIAVSPDAVAQAQARDLERREGEVRGPLHGIPVLLKDNIETRGPLPTTAGSLALAGNVTGRDAGVVSHLRAAGAVILGKTNLSEWANFRSERSSSGWSAIGGQCRNPYDPSRTPCGSSSGSGVAVAASFAPLAIGTETNGSVVCPSTVNGVVGIKPTVGLVSRFGIVPISHTQDTAGPMGRTVADAVTLLAGMIGPDANDPATEVAEEAAGWNLREHLKLDGLEGKRIGVVRSLAGFHSEVDGLLERAMEDLEAAGAEIVDELELERPEGLGQAAYDVLLYEFQHDLNAYLAGLPSVQTLPAQTLDELITFNREHGAAEMPWFDQEIFVKSAAMGPLSDEAYLEALEVSRDGSREAIDALLAEHQLDALVAPTGAPAWTIDLINGDHFIGGSSSFPARAGYPNITVPMGMVHGLPVGLSFFASALDDPSLIEIAYAYEQATRRRVPPELE
jgi:amidase